MERLVRITKQELEDIGDFLARLQKLGAQVTISVGLDLNNLEDGADLNVSPMLRKISGSRMPLEFPGVKTPDQWFDGVTGVESYPEDEELDVHAEFAQGKTGPSESSGASPQ